jgi:hypothetical protein
MSSKTLKGVKMATLKTFEEGDTIYASETNANNQALLSLLTDNATQVQKYVEGEIATIKSTVASVQQTLQNAINTKLNKDDVVAYVIEKGGSGTTWYRIYSDGWCEQGGQTGGGNRSAVRVTLPKPYKDTAYNIQITSINAIKEDLGKYNYSDESGATYSKTVAGFTISWGWGGRYWRTAGYVNVEGVE